MKFQDLKNKAKSELSGLLGRKRAKLRELRFNLASGKVKNVREIRETKKDIAKILTFLRQKEKEAAEKKGKRPQ